MILPLFLYRIRYYNNALLIDYCSFKVLSLLFRSYDSFCWSFSLIDLQWWWNTHTTGHSSLLESIYTRNALMNTMNSLFYDWILSANLLPFHFSFILVCYSIYTIRTTSPKSVHRNDETTIVCLSAAHPCGFSFCFSAFRFLWMCIRSLLETESVFYWFAITRMCTYFMFIRRFPVMIQYIFHPSSIIDHAFSQCIKSHRSLSLLPLFVDAHCESKDCVIIQHGYDSFSKQSYSSFPCSHG